MHCLWNINKAQLRAPASISEDSGVGVRPAIGSTHVGSGADGLRAANDLEARARMVRHNSSVISGHVG
jgi:hypothetical protein